jgi:mutual gliding-motility protein MglA
MALFNYATRELSAKIVYYGPGLSGKTTNIEMVHRMLRPEQKGRLISLPTETDRTLFFDFLPLDLGEIKGFKVRFHLYTVPGQVFYNATRRLVLQGVDGVVFVADSQAGMMGSNVESLKNLADNLATYGKKLADIPLVMQYNKRDLNNIASVGELDRILNSMNAPVFEGIAKDGVGVTETLVAISRRVFNGLRKTLLMPQETAESEELGDLADVTIGEKFRVQEEAGRKSAGAEPPEALEELSDFEEIVESSGIEEEVELELAEPVPAQPSGAEEPAELPYVVEEAAGEIGIDPPGWLSAPEAERAAQAGIPLEGRREVEEPPPPEPPAEPARAAAEEESFEEIEIDLPEKLRAPEAERAARAGISVEAGGGGLTFLKFEGVFASPEGHAVLPAVFLDSAGNSVRIRILVSLEEDRD